MLHWHETRSVLSAGESALAGHVVQDSFPNTSLYVPGVHGTHHGSVPVEVCAWNCACSSEPSKPSMQSHSVTDVAPGEATLSSGHDVQLAEASEAAKELAAHSRHRIEPLVALYVPIAHAAQALDPSIPE